MRYLPYGPRGHRGLATLCLAIVLALSSSACGGASKLSVELPPDSEQPTTLLTPDKRIKAIVPPAAVTDAVRLLLVNSTEMDASVPGPDGRSLLMSVDLSGTVVPSNDSSAGGAGTGSGAGGTGSGTDTPEVPVASLELPIEIRFQLQPALAPGLTVPIYTFNEVSQRYEAGSLSAATSEDGTELVFSAADFGRYGFYSLKADELPPPAPTGLKLLAASTQVRRLSWLPVPGAAGYNLYRAADTGIAEPSFSKINSALLAETTISDQLSAAGGYLYYVTSVWPENDAAQSLESLPGTTLASPAVVFDVLFEFGSDKAAGLRRPTSLALDSAGGRLFVADPYAGDVYVFSTGGKLLGSFYRYGSIEGAVPSALAYDSTLERLYVGDSGTHSIYLLNAGTDNPAPPYSLVGTFGQEGAAAGEFASPSAICIWGDEVLVADRGNDNLQVFTPLGVYLRTLAMAGSQDGQLLDPQALLIQGAGGLLIADTGNLRLAGFGDDMAPATPITLDPLLTGPLTPAGLAEDFRGQVYVSDPPGRCVRVLDSSGAELFSFGSQGSLVVELGAGGPAGLALDPLTGWLYVCDPDNSRILVFAS